MKLNQIFTSKNFYLMQELKERKLPPQLRFRPNNEKT